MTTTEGPTAHLLMDARDPRSGKLDARRVAGTFGLTMRELAQALERDPSGLSKHPTSDSLQEPLHELEEIGLHLREVFGDLGVGRMWLRAPNPVLGGRAPLSYLLERRPVAVQRLLLLAETGTPT
ncbi:MbcA/ParS/Xre antitoxin family protein [Deinococcus planocerae]|uniref:MbcA/ParS/Xre antitoxin family protein n=1 Tax=Deinococcus planocerae TaxID=1737569 RepID=UPI000C7F0FB1|nr:MbcA/ParS/Xre antitoxin family protein [Deinococcus planocerae]